MPEPSPAKTLCCVAIAGALFIPSIVFGLKPLFLVAAFFDWLPVATKWMKFGTSRALARLHVAVTLIAYLFGIAWLFTGWVGHGVTFLDAWFVAVVLGFAAAIPKRVGA